MTARSYCRRLLTRVTRFQASIAVLYVMISYILYYDSLLPLLIAVGSDFAMLTTFIVVAVTSGKSLNMLECPAMPPPPSKTSSSSSSSASPLTFTIAVPPGSDDSGSSSNTNTNSVSSYNYVRAAAAVATKNPTVDYLSFVAKDQPHCYEIKAVWGLGIALCVLFAFSALVCAGLWRRVKGSDSSAAAAANKDVEG